MLLYYNLFVHISSKNFAPGFSFPKAVAKVVPFLQPTKLFPNLFAKKSLLAHSQPLTTFKHTKNYIIKHIFHPKRPSFLTVLVGIRNSTNGVFFVKWRKCRKNRVKINKSWCSKMRFDRLSARTACRFFQIGTKKTARRSLPKPPNKIQL